MAEKKTKKRSELDGILNFSKEMLYAFLMALVFIVYIIQAFKIPTGSMEDTLLVGDFLLGLKFVYGSPVLPFTYAKFPGITDPKAGDVVIFKYPGHDKKDYIKRCIAGPGDTVEIKGKDTYVNGRKLILPTNSKFIANGRIGKRLEHFEKLVVPDKGDILDITTMPTREFLFAKHLVHQEHPRAKITARYELYIDSVLSNSKPVLQSPYDGSPLSFDMIRFNDIDNWLLLDEIFKSVKPDNDTQKVEIRKRLFINGTEIKKYKVQNDNYFMMGDNRDNSMDSRFWGFVNRKFIKAKAFILYFSLDKKVPYIMLPKKIRWNRIGKLIRNWDGTENGAILHGTNKKYIVQK